ncbi:MAG TPA: cupin domain-containing protein [Vicinamibacterales bacterium]|nr:cupin domain-containing protein [Vicinamibacterales bacterium]
MIPDDLEALALADAIGALDADERASLEARVALLTPEQQAHVASLYDVALALASSVDQMEPPARVRAAVLAATRAPGRYSVFAGDRPWTDTPLPGIQMKVLSMDQARGMATMLIRAIPGAVYPSHRHSGPEECYVIRGSVIMDGRVLRAGDFHHADADSDHGEITTTEGAEVLIVGAIEDYLPGHA